MSIDAGVYSRLTSDAGIFALIGTRAYPNVAPDTAVPPYVVYQRVGVSHVRHMANASGLVFTTFQFSVYANTQKTARLVAGEIRDSFDHLLSTTLGSGGDAVLVQAVFLKNEIDGYNPPEDGNTVSGGLFSVFMDFDFVHAESVPAH